MAHNIEIAIGRKSKTRDNGNESVEHHQLAYVHRDRKPNLKPEL